MQCELDHVNIVCQDLSQVIKFFIENLGAKLIAMKIFGGVEGASLDLGGTLINLRVKQKNECFLKNPSGKVYGYHHIGLRVDDIDASYRELVEKGFKFSTPPVDVVGLRIAFFTGPENMTFELVQIR